MSKRLLIAMPHGFCTGVRKAVDTAVTLAQQQDPPIYCLHELVHNRQVVTDLAQRGFIFVSDLEDVPLGSTLLFSAHGVQPSLRDLARERQLNIIDATCPFVAKVHEEVRRFAKDDFLIFLIGHPRHEEVIGVRGEAPDNVVVITSIDEARSITIADPSKIAVVTQTTLSQDETDQITDVLRTRFPTLQTPAKSDICYATKQRQQAAKELATQADLLIVLGSPNSSNSRRLAEVGQSGGCRSELVSDIESLLAIDLSDIETIGLTSGASTPESFFDNVTASLAKRGFADIQRVKISSS